MDQYLGQIKLVSFRKAPRGWHLCDGTLLLIDQNAALYTLLGVTYGGDGRTTFGLPDLRGKVVVGTDPNQAAYTQGRTGGLANVDLHPENFVPHSHLLSASSRNGNNNTASGTLFATVATPSPLNIYGPSANSPVPLEARSITATGGNQTHPNLQPYLTLNYIIALTGDYPPRP